MSKTDTVAQYKAEIAQLKSDNEILRIAAETAKEKKTESVYFFNATKNCIQSWAGLSETKRFFENHHPTFLASLSSDRMSTKQFHKLLATKLGL